MPLVIEVEIAFRYFPCGSFDGDLSALFGTNPFIESAECRMFAIGNGEAAHGKPVPLCTV